MKAICTSVEVDVTLSHQSQLQHKKNIATVPQSDVVPIAAIMRKVKRRFATVIVNVSMSQQRTRPRPCFPTVYPESRE